ncbi:MAG TPA: hypothetical protein VEY30_10815, partial [Myxococcaceae bacterium]|nr:hypothetical protein [Myxococcaceae bacterium]
WAWSGTAPVTRVEVAIDGGGEWREARLLPSASPHLWRRWELDWDAPAPGRHSLRVRAHDGSGATQPDVPEWNRLGYGANGVHSITVTVR